MNRKQVKKYPENLYLMFLRKKHNMTQQELAKKVGVCKNQISAYEKGWRFPRRDILIKIAKVFDVPTKNFY